MNVEKQTHVGKKVLESVIHQDRIIPGSLSIKDKNKHQPTMPWRVSIFFLFLTTILEPSGFETDCKITVHTAHTVSEMAIVVDAA